MGTPFRLILYMSTKHGYKTPTVDASNRSGPLKGFPDEGIVPTIQTIHLEPSELGRAKVLT